jgi:hypothetical protein
MMGDWGDDTVPGASILTLIRPVFGQNPAVDHETMALPRKIQAVNSP